jgi:hypothetical protein
MPKMGFDCRADNCPDVGFKALEVFDRFRGE